MGKGVLVDIPKCIGCGSCIVACKLWNNREFNENNPAFAEEPVMCSENWTTVDIRRVEKNGVEALRFVKMQCLHCLEPACLVSCFAKAFQITEDGAVKYIPRLCVGCRYCMLACALRIPRYEWHRILPNVTKCQMCHQRMEQGDVPACIAVCPTKVMTFDTRESVLAQAKDVIARDSNYVNHIYGEHELGGTSWMYISDVPFEQLGFKMNVSKNPIMHYLKDFHTAVKFILGGGIFVMSGLYMYTSRRNKVLEEKESNKSSKNNTDSKDKA
jgi:formate dehydrogenase iron-sulfur subunit